MGKIINAKVVENRQITPDIFDLRIHSPGQADNAVAGQFLGIYTGNNAMLLPRPLSICEIDRAEGILRVVYRVVGGGTKEIACVAPGGTLRVLGPLGSGYDLTTENTEGHGKEQKPLIAIVGGGLGVPPLLGLAADIRKNMPDAKIAVYMGFRDKSQVILEEDFGRYADEITVCTDDGSYDMADEAPAGSKTAYFDGNAIEAMPQRPQFDVVYGCGPKPMLKALAKYAEDFNLPCFVSVEEHMACCVGTCLACAVKARQENGQLTIKRACCDGPVFNAKELVW